MSKANETNHEDISTTQNIVLIWLDGNIDPNDEDCQNTMKQLHHVMKIVNTFTDVEQCVQFLNKMKTDKTYLIVSGAFGQQIVPRIHRMPQVESIFIFCGNKQYHEQWAKDWSKIRGVFTKIKRICEALEQRIVQCERNEICSSVVDTSDGWTAKDLNRLDPSFMYTQILKEILLTIEFNQSHIQEFIKYCRKEVTSKKDQSYIREFEQGYRDKTPVWWYSCDRFLYSMLNRGLREMDTDLIVKFGFFISDLHDQIARLHNEQIIAQKFNRRFYVFRGQVMTKKSFESRITPGRLLSFNSFLSTSMKSDVALKFIKPDENDADLVSVLFAMTIDPARSTTPFAYIADSSYFGKDEEEVLFSMHSVFRIGGITSKDANYPLFEVKLMLTSDDDTDLRQLTDLIRKETCSEVEGWARMAVTLLKMGQPTRAQQVYEILLKQATEDNVRASIYHQLGVVKDDLGEYVEAIAYYEKCLQINRKLLPSDHLDLASTYNNLGAAYRNIGDYAKALSYYESALSIQQKSSSSDDSSIIKTYNNIGNVHCSMNNHQKALEYYEQVLSIRQQSLPSNHPDLAISYSNIGNAYSGMNDNKKALSYYEKALSIRQRSLPPTHPDIATCYGNIGNMYAKMEDYEKALISYEKALIIQKKLPSPNPSRLAALHFNMGMLYEKMGDYSQAHSCYKCAVDLAKHSLPSENPDMQKYQQKLSEIAKVQSIKS